jgi:hypothetical protein
LRLEPHSAPKFSPEEEHAHAPASFRITRGGTVREQIPCSVFAAVVEVDVVRRSQYVVVEVETCKLAVDADGTPRIHAITIESCMP